MYLLYLDESGDTANWNEQDNFVISGVGVHEFRLKALGERLREVQMEYFPSIKAPIVFHATEIHSGSGRFRSFSRDEREELFKDLYNIINDNRFPSLLVFGACLCSDTAENPYDDRRRTFEEVISGFNSFLVENYKFTGGNKGLIIIDKNREDTYKELLDTFQAKGTKYGYVANIVDIPYFARCNDTPMLQLADLCSYAFYRHYEKNDDSYLNQIIPRIYRTTEGRLFGLKHLTSRTCECLACENHNNR